MSEMLTAIDTRIDAIIAAGERPRFLMFSLPAWESFKSQVPRRTYRQRNGTRFVNAYRDVPISLHDEWAYGWDVMPDRRPAPSAEAAAA